MKKKLSIALLASLAGFTLLTALSSSLAWFIVTFKLNSSNNQITGVSEGAYYEDGDGLTEETAFIISKPRHLYNLAWLQYLGYYNDTTGKQYYFKLKNDIDMTGWNLPPIGTEENPFISNFNGQGHTISNLSVSNTYTDFSTRHPSKVNSAYFASHTPNIVGMFGVVGDYNDMYTVDGNPKQGVIYDSSINTIKNTGILSTTIKSAASQTLVGIAAGYVNAAIDNVAVNESSLYTVESATPITSITSNVSDYSLIGYCTEDYLDDVNFRSDDADIPTLDNPNTMTGGDNWGGSINMLDMYTYLRGICDASPAYSYATAQRKDVDIYGEEGATTDTTTRTNSSYSNGFGEFYRYHGAKVIEDEKEYASFTFARSSDNVNFTSYNDSDTKYICLYGGKNLRATYASNSGWYGGTTNNASLTVTTRNHYLRINNGTNNFLIYNGSISNSTTTPTQVGWRWDGNYLYYPYNSRNYYLTCNNTGTLSGNTTKSTEWTYSTTDKNLYTKIGNNYYYLHFNGSAWSAVYQSSYYWLISSGNNYLTHSSIGNVNVSNTQSATQPTSENVRWYYNSSNQRFAATAAYTYYLQRNNGSTVRIRNTTNNVFTSSAESGDSVSIISGSYYLRYNSGWTASNNGTYTVKVTKVEEAANKGHNIALTEFTYDSTGNAVAQYYDTYPSYFPLTRQKNDQGEFTGSGKPDIKNTGYVVSGANLNDDTQGPYGDLRVSRFDIDDISVSLGGDETYSSNRLEVVTRTCIRSDDGKSYADSGWTRISDDYNSGNTINNALSEEFPEKANYKSVLRLNKYKNSRSQLDSTLSGGSGYIYGLHFMNAAISTSNLIEAPNVTVLDGQTFDEEGKAIGTDYQKYQLPQDSIDFNLKDQGYINFFAGTYFTNNDTFFSLHTITRNANHEITSIREIKQVYAPKSGDPSDDNPYVYSYDGTKPSNSGDLVFDTSWITSPDIVDNAVYYFEVPVNAGEYALGSVSGKNGAYLMYLDIGAGIANYKDITTTEHIETEVKNASYPAGIDFVQFTSGSTWDAVKGGKSAAVKVGTGTNAGQILLYTLEGNTLTVSTTGNEPPITTRYADDGKTVKKKIGSGAATTLDFGPPLYYNMVTDTVTFESYNVFTTSVTRTIDEVITITNASNGVQIQLDKPLTSTGFTITTEATYAVVSGPATVNATTGLVTITGSGEVKISMTYAEVMNDVEQWATAGVAVTDDTEGTIFACHFRDHDDPNMRIRYMYDGPNHIYTIYITSVTDTVLLIDALPPEGSDYQVVIIINNDTANKITLDCNSTTTSINITGSGS